jgi:hypothetical protein
VIAGKRHPPPEKTAALPVKPFSAGKPVNLPLKPVPRPANTITAGTIACPPGKRLSCQENHFPKTGFVV